MSHEKVMGAYQGGYIRRKSTYYKEEINMQNVTFSETNVLTTSNSKEIKSEKSCDLNAFGRNTQICDVEGELSKSSYDENEVHDCKLQLREVQDIDKDTGIASCQKLPYESLSNNDKKKWIIDRCKSIYAKAVSSKTYDEFDGASKGLDEIRKKMVALGCKHRERLLPLENHSKLSPEEIEAVLKNKFPERIVNKKWHLFFTRDIGDFIRSGEVTAVMLYTEFSGIHTYLCIMERMEHQVIRVTFIDSVGVPSLTAPWSQIEGYIAPNSTELFYIAPEYTDITFELGLLEVKSQYDQVHCCAWLSEFLRKTTSYQELTNDLWKTSVSIEDSLVGKIFLGKSSDDKPGNLKLNILSQLSPKYMMAVQNPKIIKSYLENHQGNHVEKEKLKEVLDREVVTGFKLADGRSVNTNIHLARKSLKYSIQLIAKELECDEGLTDFFRKNSPYYQKTVTSSTQGE